MFAIKNYSQGKKYIRIVESFRCGSSSKHRIIMSLGPYDEIKFAEINALCKEYKKLRSAKKVIEDLKDNGSALQGKGYFLRFRRY